MIEDRVKTLSELPLGMELGRRTAWLIKLRWVAAAGVTAVVLGSRYILGMDVATGRLLAGAAALFGYNAVFFVYNERLAAAPRKTGLFGGADAFANLQISADIVALSYLLHFSGGAENPFLLYFVFHMIIAGILLSRRAAYLQAVFASLVFGAAVVAEAAGFLSHHHLGGFIPLNRCPYSTGYALGTLAVLSSTLFLAVFMTTSIVGKLRDGERLLAAANIRLKEQDKIKSRYVRTVSHDMQASLASIQSCLAVVVEGQTGEISAPARDMVSRAHRRAGALLLFVKDLLNLSRMRSDFEPKKSPVGLGALLGESAAKIADKASEKNIGVSLDVVAAPAVYGDPESLGQLFDNLLANAVKYTAPGGRVEVACRQSSASGGAARVTITDTGIGIPAAEASKIFDDFYRASNARDAHEEGTGLGLAIAAEIVKNHNGRIRVESEVGRGSAFIVELPRASDKNGIKEAEQ